MLSVVPLWVTFREQTRVICHERRRPFLSQPGPSPLALWCWRCA